MKGCRGRGGLAAEAVTALVERLAMLVQSRPDLARAEGMASVLTVATFLHILTIGQVERKVNSSKEGLSWIVFR